MSRVILAGKEWRLRALLRAQLIEEGIEVEAFASVASAVANLARTRSLPALMIADLSESSQPEAEVSALSAWAEMIPVWLVASRATLPEAVVRNRGFEKIFFRPIDLAALVSAIRGRMGTPDA